MLRWLPENISTFGRDIDGIMYLIYYVVGVWLILAEGVLIYFLLKYRRRSANQRASGENGSTWRALYWVVVPAALVLICDLAIDAKGADTWRLVKFPSAIPKADVLVRIEARQFAFNFRHAGKDGILDTADDVVTNGQLHVPVGKVVKFELISKDVVHSLWMPNVRLKQDAVPGRKIEGWFDTNKIGEYGIGCAELCGTGHGVMSATLVVESQEDYEKFLAHEHEGNMTHETGFIRKYVFSDDHKTIGKQYLFLGLFMAVVGGYLAYIMRRQLAFPHEPAIPGHGNKILGPEIYNAIVTMHGTIMVFWVAMPILIGAFANFLIPLMVGADDMAFPKLNMLSFWVFFLSTIVLLASFFVPGGAAGAGWTAYPSLSVRGIAHNQWGQALWILAVALEFVAMFMGGINYLTTPLNMRAPGMKLYDLPIFVWMQMSAALIFMLSAGPLVAGAVLLLFDVLFGTGIYLPERGGDPLLWQHLFWFFGHPEVYVILLPAIGIIGEVIPVMSRKPLFGYKAMVWSTIIAGVLSFVVWAHHQFVSGLNPQMALAFSITTILISVPFAIIIFSMIATLWRGAIEFSTAMLFSVGMLAEFLIGGTTGIINGSAAADIYVHDTYYIVSHFHYTLFPSVFFGTFAGLYFWWPKMFGRKLNETLGKIHFWGTAIFFNLTFLPLLFIGLAGHQRRIYDPTMYTYLRSAQYLHVIATYGMYGLLIYQIPFVMAFFKGLRGKREAERNPWRATTLEWLAPSPPGHGNFETLPHVHRGPYEYNVPGVMEDFAPQWLELNTL